MNILGIDDNEDILKLLNTVITSKGHDFTQALNGKDGIKLIEEQNFDAILLDLAMPGFSGLDVIESLKKSNKLKDQKIILFTASSATDKEIDVLLKHDGIKSCIRKPVDINLLINKVEEVAKS
ncbi:MAG: response regulator [Thaumarchaeota archaeon]|nr:response regulator [Nitrososphaerota archaeon]